MKEALRFMLEMLGECASEEDIQNAYNEAYDSNRFDGRSLRAALVRTRGLYGYGKFANRHYLEGCENIVGGEW